MPLAAEILHIRVTDLDRELGGRDWWIASHGRYLHWKLSGDPCPPPDPWWAAGRDGSLVALRD